VPEVVVLAERGAMGVEHRADLLRVPARAAELDGVPQPFARELLEPPPGRQPLAIEDVPPVLVDVSAGVVMDQEIKVRTFTDWRIRRLRPLSR